MDSEPGGVTCDSDDVDNVEVSTELTEEQIPVLQVETAESHVKSQAKAEYESTQWQRRLKRIWDSLKRN